MGQAYGIECEWEAAKTVLFQAAKLNPKSKEIRDELEIAKKELAAQIEEEKKQPKLFSGIFSSSNRESQKEKDTSESSSS